MWTLITWWWIRVDGCDILPGIIIELSLQDACGAGMLIWSMANYNNSFKIIRNDYSRGTSLKNILPYYNAEKKFYTVVSIVRTTHITIAFLNQVCDKHKPHMKIDKVIEHDRNQDTV